LILDILIAQARNGAYDAAAGLDDECPTWDAFGELSCTKEESQRSVELGSNDDDNADDEL
jgi:hypothetical protein